MCVFAGAAAAQWSGTTTLHPTNTTDKVVIGDTTLASGSAPFGIASSSNSGSLFGRKIEFLPNTNGSSGLGVFASGQDSLTALYNDQAYIYASSSLGFLNVSTGTYYPSLLAHAPLAANEPSYIGIGTSHPQSMLHIVRPAASSTNIANSYLHLGGFESAVNSYRLIGFGFSGSAANQPAYIGFQEKSTAGYTTGDLIFATRTVGDITDSAPTERMRIGNNGYIGMGQAPDPYNRLAVGAGGTGANSEGVKIDSGSGTGGSATVFFSRNNAGKAWLGVSGGTSNIITGDSANQLGISSISNINFSANFGQTLHMVLTNGGNVGIGATPNQKLSVGGVIESTTGGVKFPDGSVQTSAFVGNGLSIVKDSTSSLTWSVTNVNPNAAAVLEAVSGDTVNSSHMAFVRLASRRGTNSREWWVGMTDPSDANENFRIRDTNGTTRMTITHDGQITFAGNVTGTTIRANYQDVAEWVPATQALEAGTVVILNPASENEVMPSQTSYDTSVAGVVSAQPGVLLGQPGASKAAIATTGRVKVRVDASKTPIHVGDLLVTSDQPGTAMKSEPFDAGGTKIHRPGTLIGKALQPLESGQGEILVLLSLQ